MPISSLLLLPEVWDVKLTFNSTFLLPSGRSYHCSGLVPGLYYDLKNIIYNGCGCCTVKMFLRKYATVQIAVL